MGISKWLTERDKEQEGFPVSQPPRTATPDLLTGNLVTVPKLLRMMAKSQHAQAHQHNIIFDEAASMIDQQAQIMVLLEDVPGTTALEKVTRLKTVVSDAVS